jgi:hypothetical protein
VAGILLVATSLLLPATRSASAQGPEFTFTLYGGNEVPGVVTDATGTVALQLGDGEMTYHLQASGAEFTMAHIHAGSPGVNGPVIAFLLPMQDPPLTTVDVSGTITVDDLVGEFAGNWDSFVTSFLADLFYVNIHSVANPGGELRAQADPRFCADLSGENEIPANDSQGSGTALVDANIAGIGFSIGASTETNITAAHIHQGAADENGPILAPLLGMAMTGSQTVSTSGTIGLAELADGPAEDNVGAFLHYIASGDSYVNVHSTGEPDGEIRGPLAHCSNEDAAAPPDPTVTPTPTETTTVVPTNTTAPTATTVPPTATSVPPTLIRVPSP